MSAAGEQITNAWVCVLGQERHKFSVDLLGARPGYAVRTAFDLHVLDVLDHLCLPQKLIQRWQEEAE